MARVPSKHERDQNLDFQGFLNDLQDWELNLKNRDKKTTMKDKRQQQQPQAPSRIGEDRGLAPRTPVVNSPKSNSGQYAFSRDFNGISHLSSSFMTDENMVDAASEKELGNEYFKQKKFKEAIDCYSRSIALSPTAVAYANRAMAYLKIKRFQEAEEDCTEALNLDDRYIKAYSRRATARKELGKLKESIEDSEFAMRLEPNNQEIKKQYADVKSLYEKVLLQKASEVLKSSAERAQKGESSETRVNRVAAVDSLSTQKDVIMENDKKVSVHKSPSVKELESRGTIAGSQTESQAVKHPLVDASQRKHRTGKQELRASIQELASQATSRAMTEASKSIVPPTSAYQFEVSWRGFLGDRVLQSQLLKVTSPRALPQIFKNALSASLLLDIINCVATFFREDMDLAVKYLQNLTKIPRFDMLVMFLSATDKADLLRTWNEVFCNEATPIEYAEILENLRPKYCLN